MGCAVKVPEMNAIIFLESAPPGDWAGLEFEEGAWVEVSPDDRPCPEGDAGPRSTLCRSTTDPKHYKLFWCERGIDRSGFIPTGMHLGGVYTRPMWERLVEALPSIKAFNAIGGDDPPGAMDQAMRYLREAR